MDGQASLRREKKISLSGSIIGTTGRFLSLPLPGQAALPPRDMDLHLKTLAIFTPCVSSTGFVRRVRAGQAHSNPTESPELVSNCQPYETTLLPTSPPARRLPWARAGV